MSKAKVPPKKAWPLARRLKRIRARILKGWTKGEMARDKEGRTVPASSKLATCWCLAGAVEAEMKLWDPLVRDDLRRLLRGAIGKHTSDNNVSIVTWNDYMAKDEMEVVKVIDIAIDIEQKQRRRDKVQ